MMKTQLNPNKMIGLGIVLIFILLSVFRISIFGPIETKFYDMAMQYAGSDNGDTSRIVLVDIDDKSLSQLGSWPWPRKRIADLLSILKKADAALVGIHLPLIDRKPAQGLLELKSFREKFTAYASVKKNATMTAWVLENLDQMENALDNDGVLTSSVQNTGNVILAGYTGAGKRLKRPDRKQNSLLRNNALTQKNLSDDFKERHATNQVALPFPELSQAARGLGIWQLHPDEKMAGRSHPIFINYGGSFLPSFPLRMALAILKEKPKQAVIEENRILLKGRHIPLINGEMLITFRNGQSPFRKFSFVDILKAKKTPSVLKGQIILIGLQSSGGPGINTPLSPSMPESHLAAHVLDGIINNRFISRPTLLGVIEILAMIILACFAALAFPPMNQRIRLAWAAGLTILVLVIGVALFSIMKIWFKPVHVIAPLIIIYAVFSLKQLFTAGRVTKESIETNRLLGLSFQSQGLLDKC